MNKNNILLDREALTKFGVDDFNKKWHFDAQSMGFMAEIIPTIQKIYRNNEKLLKVVDVGARTGAGTKLLAYIFNPLSRNRLRMNLTAIDIDPTYKNELENIPNTQFLVKNIFDIENNSYDLSICSHTIEHLEDPYGFILQLKNISNDYVIISCPIDEWLNSAQIGHPRIVTKQFIEQFCGKIYYYDSSHWLTSKSVISVISANTSKDELLYLNATKIANNIKNEYPIEKNISLLNESLNIFSQRASTYFNLSQLLLQTNFSDALNALYKGCQIDSYYIPAYNYFFTYLFKKNSGKNYNRFEVNNHNSIKLSIDQMKDLNNFPMFCFFCGDIFERNILLREAIAAFYMGFEIGILKEFFAYRISLLYIRMKKYNLSKEIILEGLKYNQNNFNLQWALAKTLFDGKLDIKMAAYFAEQAANTMPFLPRCTSLAAKIFEEIGDIAKADHYKKLCIDYK